MSRVFSGAQGVVFGNSHRSERSPKTKYKMKLPMAMAVEMQELFLKNFT